MNRFSWIIVAALSLVSVSRGTAQELGERPEAHRTPTLGLLATPTTLLANETEATTTSAAFLPQLKYGGWVSVTKWVSLAAATGFGTLGFALHDRADESFDELETLCTRDPDNCRRLNPDGSYADSRLESLFQDAVDRDNQARLSLVAAEVSFGLSVLLFIVDFQKHRSPANVPYKPEKEESRLRFSVRPGELAFKYYLE
jgi:hypothetical protein